MVKMTKQQWTIIAEIIDMPAPETDEQRECVIHEIRRLAKLGRELESLIDKLEQVEEEGEEETVHISVEVQLSIIEQLTAIKVAAENLTRLYENNYALNAIQPDSMRTLLPFSLDDWSRDIQDCKEDWRQIFDSMR